MLPDGKLMEFVANHCSILTCRQAAADVINFRALFVSRAVALVICLATALRGAEACSRRLVPWQANGSVLCCTTVALVAALRQGVASTIPLIHHLHSTGTNGCCPSSFPNAPIVLLPAEIRWSTALNLKECDIAVGPATNCSRVMFQSTQHRLVVERRPSTRAAHQSRQRALLCPATTAQSKCCISERSSYRASVRSPNAQ